MRIAAVALLLAGCATEVATASPRVPQAKTADTSASILEVVGDEVSACTDFAARYFVPAERERWQPPPLAGEFAADTAAGEVAIAVPCAQQLSGRTALASCKLAAVAGSVDGIPRTLAATVSYYTPAAVENDAAMLSCVKEGGAWTAVARDSSEVRRARLGEVRSRLRAIR